MTERGSEAISIDTMKQLDNTMASAEAQSTLINADNDIRLPLMELGREIAERSKEEREKSLLEVIFASGGIFFFFFHLL